MDLRKKGAVGTNLILGGLFLVVVILACSVIYFGVQQQTAVVEEEDKPVEDKSAERKAGEITVLKTWAVDKQANTETQIKVPAYFWLEDASGNFISWIGGTSGYTLSATTTTSVSPVTIGTIVNGIAFNRSFYGEKQQKEIKIEGEQMKLNSHTICNNGKGGLEILLYDDQTNIDKNISVPASQSESYDYLRFKNNGTDCAYNLAGFMFDIVSASNISTIAMKSDADYTSVSKSNIAIERKKDEDDFVFALSSPVMLKEGEKWYSGTLTVTADGDGCSSTAGEPVDIRGFDEAKYVDRNGVGIKSGWEDNQDTPVDVGSDDVLDKVGGSGASFHCTS